MPKNKQVEGQLSFADFLVSKESMEPSDDSAGQSEPVTSVGSLDPAGPAKLHDPAPGLNESAGCDGDDALFEKEFALLTKLFDSVKTGDFDPMEYLSPIANAVKTMQGEGISFAEALERHCSKMSAEKIIAAFPADLQQKLVEIIGGMHDEI